MPKYFKIAVILFYFLLGFAIYSNSFHGEFVFDDVPFITNNTEIRDISDIERIWHFLPSRFIGFYSFALNYHFFKLNVLSYHIINVMLHCVAAIFVWLFLLMVFETPSMGHSTVFKEAVAFIAATIFLAHPLQTGAVVYIWQRVTILAAIFYIVSCISFIKAMRTSSIAWYVVTFLTALCAFFSKENAYSLPLMYVWIYFCCINERPILNIKQRYPRLYYSLPIMVIALLLMAAYVLSVPGIDKVGVFERLNEGFFSGQHLMPFEVNVSASNTGDIITSWNYLMTQYTVLLRYVGLLVMPVRQNLDYHIMVPDSFFAPEVMAGVLLQFLLLFIIVYFYPRKRYVAFAMGWFVITLLIESSIIPLTDMLFEHRLYVPIAGFAILLSAGLYEMIAHRSKVIFIIVLFIVISAYSTATYARNFVWQSRISLWSDVILKSPNKDRPYTNRGSAYAARKEYDLALADYQRALERSRRFYRTGEYATYDDSVILELNEPHALILTNIALAFGHKGDDTNALLYFNRALEIHPRFALAYLNRARLFRDQGALDKALSDFEEVLTIEPKNTDALIEAGLVKCLQGDYKEASRLLDKAIECDGGLADAYNLRGIINEKLGEHNKATKDFSRAAEIEPDKASFYWEKANALKGILPDSVDQHHVENKDTA